MSSVIKRDGTTVRFDSSKIGSAITKANTRSQEMSPEDIEKIVSTIEARCQKLDNIDVEQIQDLVEKTLLASRFKATAKQYILYRDQRTRIRQSKSKLLKEVGEKLAGRTLVNQNANVDEASFGGRKGEANAVLMKEYALNYCMSEKSRENHLNNEIYIHDLDSYATYMHNCLSIPFDKLLAEGFKTRQTDVRPAGSISTALQLVAVIFQLQSLQQFGGVSATHLDWTLVPYVRKSFAKHYKDGLNFIENKNEDEINHEILNILENAKDYSIEDEKYKTYSNKAYDYATKMTKRELDQAVEGLYHNLNY